MATLQPIIEKYLLKGISKDNIDYAIESVKEGAKREHIMESLTADYRGVAFFDASDLLNELYDATGGEFKIENRNGYVFGAFFLLVGVCSTLYIAYVLTYNGGFNLAVCGIGLTTLLSGVALLLKAASGKYRDSDAPFK